jgi:DNA polymerase III subunit delta'
VNDLTGHDAAWREWHAALASPRMHHAWILAGLRGIGKAAFAQQAAAIMVAEPGAAQPSAAAHPDIITLEPLPANDDEAKKQADGKPFQLKRNITIDQIRRMQQRLVTRPTLGSRRAIIIDPADDLEKGAVNALLKSLEEPPVGTFFLLVAHRPGRLLPTIRSRCRMLRFDPLETAQITAILAREVPEASAATRDAAALAAEGSPGAALEFVAQDLGRIHQLMSQILHEGDATFALRGSLAEAIGARPDRERQLATVELARAAIAAGLRQAERSSQRRMIEVHAELVRIGGQLVTYNFDPGLLVLEIGGLLASVAVPRETA